MELKRDKILVVDDTEPTRYAIVRTLKANGFDTLEAATGQEALSLVRSAKPDLVTLDIHLPDLLGFEVCRKIKMDPSTSRIPVLQVSASYVTSRDQIHGLEGGADGYLTHPFEPAVLIATVKALLRTKQLYENLRLSELRLQVAIKNAPILVYTCDLNQRYTWIYNPPKPLLPSDFIGKTDFDIFSEVEAQNLLDLKADAIKSRMGRRNTISLTFNQMERIFDVTAEPILGPDGDLAGLTVACIDVTERMQVEIAQKKATEEAESASRAKSRFLANISHEIRTPLGIIQGFTDLALDPEVNALEQREYLLTIKRNAQSLTELLGKVLDLSKVEADRMLIEKTRFSLIELLSEVVEALKLQANEKGIQLAFKLNEPFPKWVTTDPVRLRQILMNVISNAVKFTLKGRVEVMATLSKPSQEREPAEVAIRIRDTGIGISSEQQLRLFHAFTQADSSTTRKFGGTGLGLNLSKKLAHLLGGDLVLIESIPDQGSTFQLTFDVGVLSFQDFPEQSQRGVESGIQNSQIRPDELRGMNILLVEDSSDNRILFSRHLKRAGAQIELASDGFEGVELAKKGTFDAILMDVQMPNLDGYGATSIIRKVDPSVPIIALTAYALKEERERALKAGFTHYLIKPIGARALIQALIDVKKQPSHELTVII